MPSIRFRLDKPSLTGLADRVRQEYGPHARILDAEERVIGGMGGFFGRRVVDVTVEIPDPVAPDDAHAFDLPRRVGIMALLEDADAADDAPNVPAPMAAPPAVSTERTEFASVLDGLRIDVDPAPAAGGGTPARPLRPRGARPAPAAEAVPEAAAPARPRHAALQERAPVPVPEVLPDPRVALTVPVDRPPTRALTASAAVVVPPAPPAAPPAVIAPPAAVLVRRRPEPSPQAVAQVQWATPSPRSRVGRAAPGVAPEPRSGAGDLLLLVGRGDAAVGVANAVRDRLRSGYVCDGGSVEGNTRRRVDDRRGALAARAYGVRSDQPVIVAYGLDDADVPAGLLEIEGDQAWLVVDAAADPDETWAWAEGLRGRVQIDAIAGLHAGGARSPAIERIGLPLAWTDRAPGRISA